MKNLQPDMLATGWLEVLDGNPTARDLFTRHYSNQHRKRGRKQPALIVGPGNKMLLITADAGAVVAWRKEQYRLDDQTGVNCAIFRRERGDLASELLLNAMRLAWLAAQDQAVQIAYANSGTFVRTEPMMQTGFAALGFTSGQIDAFYVAAADL